MSHGQRLEWESSIVQLKLFALGKLFSWIQPDNNNNDDDDYDETTQLTAILDSP